MSKISNLFKTCWSLLDVQSLDIDIRLKQILCVTVTPDILVVQHSIRRMDSEDKSGQVVIARLHVEIAKLQIWRLPYSWVA